MTNWQIVGWFGQERQNGRVYGQPRFEDGHEIITSEIVRQDGNEIETRNTIYRVEGD